MDLQPLLTVPEVAKILGVRRQRVYRLKAEIGHVLVGARTIRFRQEDVAAYIERRSQCPSRASASSPDSTSGATLRTSRRSSPRPTAPRSLSPRAAEIAARLLRGPRIVK